MKIPSLLTVFALFILIGSCAKSTDTLKPQACQLTSYGVTGGVSLSFTYGSDHKLAMVNTSEGESYTLVYSGNDAKLMGSNANGLFSDNP